MNGHLCKSFFLNGILLYFEYFVIITYFEKKWNLKQLTLSVLLGRALCWSLSGSLVKFQESRVSITQLLRLGNKAIFAQDLTASLTATIFLSPSKELCNTCIWSNDEWVWDTFKKCDNNSVLPLKRCSSCEERQSYSFLLIYLSNRISLPRPLR